jgi:hypothetical protein
VCLSWTCRIRTFSKTVSSLVDECRESPLTARPRDS